MKTAYTKSSCCRNGSLIKCSYGSISKRNSNALLGCVLSRNTVALEIELTRIAKEAAGNTKINFPKIIAQICVGKKLVKFDLAFEMFECLNEVRPRFMMMGIYEMIDQCIEYGKIDEAIRAYMRLHNMGLKLDISGKERMLDVLASNCRIADLVIILNDHQVTGDDLVLVAEPFFMTGNVILFAGLLNKYLDQRVFGQIKCSEKVSRVIRSIMFARLRRFVNSSDPTFEENEGMNDIFKMLESYHMRLSCDTNSNYSDVSRSPSHFQARQLHEVEKGRLLNIDESDDLSYDDELLMQLFPEFEATGFSYITEDDGQTYTKLIDNQKINFSHYLDISEEFEYDENDKKINSNTLRINDITTEFKKFDPSRILLYEKNLFPEAYEQEVKYLRQQSESGSLMKIRLGLGLGIGTTSPPGSMIVDEERDVSDDAGAEEYGIASIQLDDNGKMVSAYNEDDEDVTFNFVYEGDDDDEDVNDSEDKQLAMKMSSLGRSSIPPSFYIKDLTDLLFPLKLTFQNDIFIHSYDANPDNERIEPQIISNVSDIGIHVDIVDDKCEEDTKTK